MFDTLFAADPTSRGIQPMRNLTDSYLNFNKGKLAFLNIVPIFKLMKGTLR